MAGPTLILALDVGTSSTRSALFTLGAKRLLETTAHEAYALRVGTDGAAELDPSIIEGATLRCITRTLQAARRLPGKPVIVAVGMSCFWHSLLGETRGLPTPIYTWGDARCGPDAARLREAINEKAYHARTGCLLRTPYWPAKLRWLRRTRKFSRTLHWLSPPDWLYGRLCGQATTSLSMASGTGMLDGRAHRWDQALMKRCGVHEHQMTPLSDQPMRTVVGTSSVLPPLHRFPELQDAQWFPALGDGACSNLGSDAVTPHLAALNIGTSGAVRLVRDRRAHVPFGLFCYRLDATRALVGGAISNAGNLRAWALRELRLDDDPAKVEQALRGREWPRHGLTVLPFWTGERAPTWPEARSGTVTGFTYSTTALDLLQALTESTYHRLAQITDELARGAGRLDLVVSGGIRHSAGSMQRLADVLGRPLRACTEPEASLRGAAVYVAERLGHRVMSLRPGRLFRPRPRAAEAYAAARLAQIRLEKTMAGSPQARPCLSLSG